MRIFICYRRNIGQTIKDRIFSQHIADRIYDRLVKQFGREAVFSDLDLILSGQDFPKIISSGAVRCDVLLAVIGQNWASATDERGQKELESPQDYVRREIETALQMGIRIIPLCDDNACMPREEDLPVSLQPLVSRNALRIRPGNDFEGDMARLVKELRKRSGGWIPAIFRRSSRGSTLRPWIAGTAILTLGLVFGLAMISVRPRGKDPIEGPINKPNPGNPDPKEPPQPPAPVGTPVTSPSLPVAGSPVPGEGSSPPTKLKAGAATVAPLTSADDLKKVVEQIECGDFAKARELVQQLKCQCANDPVLDFYEAAAAALAAGSWNGEPETLMRRGQEQEARGPAADRGHLDPMLKCLLPYLKQEDKVRFQKLLGRSIE
ncbi:MAG: toll/interleukin-1 receptor domain-containing protein [Isosphaeraceae bacterium]